MVVCKNQKQPRTHNRTNEKILHYVKCSVNRIGDQAGKYKKVKKKGPLTLRRIDSALEDEFVILE
jgi:hypothetical protein